MIDKAHSRADALKGLQAKSGRGAPWLLIDPGLQADIVSAYRAVRLLFFAVFALVGHPLRSQASNDNHPTDTQILQSASSYERFKSVRSESESRIERHERWRPRTRSTADRGFPSTIHPQLVCLKSYRPHAPPRGEIPNEISHLHLTPNESSAFPPRTDLPLASFFLASSSTPASFLVLLRPFHATPLNAVPAHRYQLPQTRLTKGDACYVCC